MVQQDKEKILEELKKPLPKESISPHPTKSYLSTIKAIYVVERLNDVFGLGGWAVKNEFVERVGEMVVIKSTLSIPAHGILIESFGGNDNKDLGDAYKGACTDALTKIGSYLYIGMDVFKGLSQNANTNETPKIDYVKKITETKKSLEKVVGEICRDCKSAKYILNPKTEKVFCQNKCWTQEKADEETKDGYNSHLDLSQEQQEAIPL